MSLEDEVQRLRSGLRAIQRGGLWGLTNEEAFRNIRVFAGRVADGMTTDQAFDAQLFGTLEQQAQGVRPPGPSTHQVGD